MTLKEIARQCETSVSTVSRVLNNNSPSCASEELKNRIWQVAQSMAYTPNAHARNLKKGLGQTQPIQIAVVLARIHALEDDPFFSELYRCIEIELCAQGCLLTAHSLGLLPEISVDKNKPDGIIILGRCSAALLQDLRRITHNLVCISRNPLDFQVDEVVCSGQKAARMALEYLIALGHRKIAYIGDCSYEERYTGYCETLIDHHLPLDYHAVFPTNQTQAAGFAAMNKLLQKTDISAVLCANDATAIGSPRGTGRLTPTPQDLAHFH